MKFDKCNTQVFILPILFLTLFPLPGMPFLFIFLFQVRRQLITDLHVFSITINFSLS